MPAKTSPQLPTGIYALHSRSCSTSTDRSARCSCSPTYRSVVYSAREKAAVRKVFPTLAAAKAWRIDQQAALNRGRDVVARSALTVREAAEEFLAGATAEPPTVLNRSGAPFKPSAIRGYASDLRRVVVPALGHVRLVELRRGQLQALIDELVGKGASSGKVRNVATCVRALYSWAISRDLVETNPTTQLRLPAPPEARDRDAAADELEGLLAVLPDDLRPIYATAAYAGLRRGELRGLRWSDIDLDGRRIAVERGWDDYAGEVGPKSKAGRRLAPMPRSLHRHLAEHHLAAGRPAEGFVFATSTGGPFTPTNVRKRALRVWAEENERRTEQAEEAGTTPELLHAIGLHECRHSAVSLWHAAGVRREVCEDWAGHSSGAVHDRYRHLRPETFSAELARLDAYLDGGAQLVAVGS